MNQATIGTMEARRRREIEFLARDLYRQVQDLLTSVGDLVPAELSAGRGGLVEGTPLNAVAERLDDAAVCFRLLQEELGLRDEAQARYARSTRTPA